MKNLMSVLWELGYYEEKNFYVVSDLKENEEYIKENLKMWDYEVEYDEDIVGNKIVVFYIKKEL
jgi:hypothetical protein